MKRRAPQPPLAPPPRPPNPIEHLLPRLRHTRRCQQTIARVYSLVRARGGNDDDRVVYHLPTWQRAYTWTAEQSARFLSRAMRGWPLGTAILWGQGLGDDKTLTVVDGQQRLTALGALVLRPDGEPTPTPRLYLDLGAYAHAPDDAVIWHEEPRGEYSPTVHDLVSWRTMRELNLDGVAGHLYMEAAQAFQDAEMHIVRAGGWGADRLTPDEVRELFVLANTGGTPMSEAEVLALVGGGR